MSTAPEFALGSEVSCLGYTVRGDQSTLSRDAVVGMARDLQATLRKRGVTAIAPPFWAFRMEGTEAEIGLWCPVADELGDLQIRKATFPEARYLVVQGVPLGGLWDRFEGMTRWAEERSLPWDLVLAHTSGPGVDVPPESYTVDLNLRLSPPRPSLMTRPAVRYQPVQFSDSPLIHGWEGFVDMVGRVRAMAIERGYPIEGGAFWQFGRTGHHEVEYDFGRAIAFTLCLPLREGSATTGDDGIREQASGTYATVTHQGPPDQLSFTYELLVNWVAAQGLRWHEGIGVLQPEAEREQDQSKWRVELAIRTLGPGGAGEPGENPAVNHQSGPLG